MDLSCFDDSPVRFPLPAPATWAPPTSASFVAQFLAAWGSGLPVVQASDSFFSVMLVLKNGDGEFTRAELRAMSIGGGGGGSVG